MTEPEGISMAEFQALVEHADLNLTAEELQSLKPMYEHFARQAAVLHDLDLDVEDLAVAFSPDWDPPEQAGEGR